MTEPAERYEHAGVVIEIHYDDSGHGNPAEDNDGWLTRCVHTHRRYNLLGASPTPEDRLDFEVDCTRCGGAGYEVESEDDDCERCGGSGRVQATAHDWLRAEHDAFGPILNLYVYEHGGIVLRAAEGASPFDCRWDSGQVGWVFWTKEGIERTGAPATDEEIAKGIKAEVQEYSDWQMGRVFGYIVDPGGEHEDSCWGFIGDEGLKVAKSEAESAAEFVARERERERAEAEYWATRDVATL